MPRFFVVLLVLLIFITCQAVWAQLNPYQEKRLNELEAKEKAWKEWERTKSEQKESIEDFSIIERALGKKQLEEKNYKSPSDCGNPGKYQAVRMDSNAIFIIDTQEGHIWVWVIQPDREGRSSEFLFYQGQVLPGSNMGELMDRTYPKIPAK